MWLIYFYSIIMPWWIRYEGKEFWLDWDLSSLHNDNISMSEILKKACEMERETCSSDIIALLQSVENNQKHATIKDYLTECTEQIGEKLKTAEKNEGDFIHMLWTISSVQHSFSKVLEIVSYAQQCASQRCRIKQIKKEELTEKILKNFSASDQIDMINTIEPSVLFQIQHFSPDFFDEPYIVLQFSHVKQNNQFVNELGIKVYKSTVEGVNDGDFIDMNNFWPLFTKYNIILIPVSREDLSRDFFEPVSMCFPNNRNNQDRFTVFYTTSHQKWLTLGADRYTYKDILFAWHAPREIFQKNNPTIVITHKIEVDGCWYNKEYRENWVYTRKFEKIF